MSGSKNILFVVYIRTSHLIKSSSFFFKNYPTHPKSIIKRKWFNIWKNSENNLGIDNMLLMILKHLFILLNMIFKLPLKPIYIVKNQRKHYFGWMGVALKIAHYESYEKNRPQKVTQYRRISHNWLITKQSVSTLKIAPIHS